IRAHGLYLHLLAVGTMTAGLMTGGDAFAQAPRNDGKEQLEQVRRLNEIAAQKIEADVRAAYQEADRLSTTDPERAAARLKSALSQVEDDPSLSMERRDSLTRMLKVRIRYLELMANRPVERTTTAATANQRRLEDDRRDAEQETIGRTLESIRTLR